MLVGAFISAVIQLSTGKTTISLEAAAPPQFIFVFVLIQLAASTLCLASLYMIDGNKYHATRLHRSLTVELIGLIFLQTAIAINVTASGFFNSGLPPSPGTWFTIMFWLWSWTRVGEIRRATRELVKERV